MVGPYSSAYKCEHKMQQQLRVANARFLLLVPWKGQHEEAYGMALFKYHDNGEEFFHHGMIILLQLSQFTRSICNRLFLLDDYSTHLVVRIIGINMERYIVVGVCHKDICSQDSFHDFKWFVHFRDPTKDLFTRFIRLVLAYVPI